MTCQQKFAACNVLSKIASGSGILALKLCASGCELCAGRMASSTNNVNAAGLGWRNDNEYQKHDTG